MLSIICGAEFSHARNALFLQSVRSSGGYGVVQGICKHERSKVRLALAALVYGARNSWGMRFMNNDKENKLSRDPHVIASKLQGYLPNGDRIDGVEVLSVGFSNETYLVTGLDLILRLPPQQAPLLAPFAVHDVVTQYHIMQEFAARPSAPPMPRGVLLETDTAVLGAPFFLMERLDSDPWDDWGTPPWVATADDAFRASVSAQFVEMYARLHSLAPLDSLGRPQSNSDELERWRRPVAELGNADLLAAFGMLAADIPADQAYSPCHGDAKVANILWKDGRIVAMLDYEMNFNGDPRWDIGALLEGMRGLDGKPLPAGDVRGVWGRDHIVAAWEAQTGRRLEREYWFGAAGRARYAAILAYGAHQFAAGDASDKRFASFATIADQLSRRALELARMDAYR